MEIGLLTWSKICTFSVASFSSTLIVGKSNDYELIVEAISDQISEPNWLRGMRLF